MPELLMLVGPQGVGKTKYISELNKPNYTLVSSDLFWGRDEQTGKRYWQDDYGHRHDWGTVPIPEHIMARAWRYAHQEFLKALDEGKDIVFEATFPRRRDRSRIVDIAKYYNYEVNCVCLMEPLDVCATRNRSRRDRVPDRILAKTYYQLQLPTEDEGFDSVEVIGDVSYED
jgi:predicted kinase